MEPAEVIKAYLDTMIRVVGSCQNNNFLYVCAEDFALREGKGYIPGPRPARFRRGLPKHCFRNAAELAAKKGLVYVEGFAASVIPVPHAWNVKPGSDKVIDVTWETPGSAYWGVAFDFPYVLKCLKKSGSVLQNWRDDYKLFRGLVPREEWFCKG